MVYEFFKVPQTVTIPCEITTADIMEYIRRWLTENNLWTNRQAKLEDLMNYIVEKRGVSDAYELGIRICSIPLAVGVRYLSLCNYWHLLPNNFWQLDNFYC